MSLDLTQTWGMWHATIPGLDGLEVETGLAPPLLPRFEAVVVMQPNLGLSPAERAIAKKIRGALNRGGFEAHFQPIVDAASGKIAGFEALARLPDADRGFVMPGDFLPVAEKKEWLASIDAAVMNQSAALLQILARNGRSDLYVSVNLSEQSLRSGSRLIRTVHDAVRNLPDYGRRNLRFEIVESTDVLNDRQARRTIERLSRAGFELFMDDFGTGLTGMATLRDAGRFFKTLKIDRSFANIADEHAASVLRAAIMLAQCLNMGVVVEGVETRQMQDFLRDLGVQCQGYLFGRPKPLPDAVQSVIGGRRPMPQQAVA